MLAIGVGEVPGSVLIRDEIRSKGSQVALRLDSPWAAPLSIKRNSIRIHETNVSSSHDWIIPAIANGDRILYAEWIS